MLIDIANLVINMEQEAQLYLLTSFFSPNIIKFANI